MDKLSWSEFVLLSRCIESFAKNCEDVVTGVTSTILRLTLQGQASDFVRRFHEERREKLGLLFETETWTASEVLKEFQRMIDYIEQTGQVTLVSSAPKSPDFSVCESCATSDCLELNARSFQTTG